MEPLAAVMVARGFCMSAHAYAAALHPARPPLTVNAINRLPRLRAFVNRAPVAQARGRCSRVGARSFAHQ